VEENQPLPCGLRRAMSKLPLPLEATAIRSKRSCLTGSSTSQASGSSSQLPKTPTLESNVTPVTPKVTGTSVTKVESSQLPKETRTQSSEMIT